MRPPTDLRGQASGEEGVRHHVHAGPFFDSLAQFYRKAYLRWIDATKRSPAKRAERIAEMIKLLDAGVKQRPNS